MPVTAHDRAVAVMRTTSVEAGGHEVAVRVVSAHDQPFALFPSMGEYPVYDDGTYDRFDHPDQRIHAYRHAIETVVAGKVVLDIGTGRDGLWAVHAARAGARHVFAVEQQPSAAGQARQAVADAGLTDRVTVIEGLSTEADLPQPAQVCISEIVGNIASSEGAVAALNDARRRLCTTDCVWIPFRIQTWAAAIDLSPVLAPGDYALATESLPYLRHVFDSVGHPFDLRLCLGGPAGDLLVSSAATLESIVFDHRRDPPPTDLTTVADLTVGDLTVGVANPRMTGLLLWTRVAVTSHSPEIDTLTGDSRGWAPVYVPLSRTGIPVRPGSTLEVTFRRTTSDDRLHPDYELALADPAHPNRQPLRRPSPHHGTDFRRSALHRHLFPAT
jgi:protein arginine N-methyltransferase 1